MPHCFLKMRHKYAVQCILQQHYRASRVFLKGEDSEVVWDIYQFHFFLHFPANVEVVFLVHFKCDYLPPVAACLREHLCVRHPRVDGQLGQ